MKPVNVKNNTYIDFGKDIINKNPKFQIADHVRISKYKSIFAKGFIPNWSVVGYFIKKVENVVSLTNNISDLNDEEVIGKFYEK